MSKLGTLIYAKRHYGWPVRELLSIYRDAEIAAKSDSQNMFGERMAVMDHFFAATTRRQEDESIDYQCVNGCCVVVWHPRRGNTGGWGPAGCSCDNLKDPRDLARGPLDRPASLSGGTDE